MTRILAIDDDSGRYDHLRRLLAARPGGRVELEIAACPMCVHGRLAMEPDAVLFDYDLDSGDPCPLCLRSYGEWAEEFTAPPKGTIYAHRVRREAIPTIVVSASAPANVEQLMAALRGGAPLARISAVETDPELRWLGRLWAWGVL